MIWFERSIDYDLIRSIITHPKLYPHLSDDNSPAPEDFQPIRHEAIWYVVVRDIVGDTNGETLGLWMFVPQNSICWDVHTALLPAAWGAKGQIAARMLPGWIWQNTICRRIITSVPATNRLALHFAIKAGMKVYAVNEASYLKKGKLCDQICLGLSRDQDTYSRAEIVAELPEELKEETCRQP